MASVVAIVSKAVFERDARNKGEPLDLGQIWPTASYNSRNKRLQALTEGGALFLITVRPPEDAWLVAILEAPRFDSERWVARANVEAARDVSGILDRLRFDNGKGLNLEPGKLGMSLQTPRVLTDDDVALLRAAAPKPVSPLPNEPGDKAAEHAAQADQETVDVAEPLLASVAALRADDPAGGLDALLDAWSASKSAETAMVIERLGAIIDRGLAPLDEDLSAKEFEARWLDIARGRRSTDVTRLMRSVGRGSARAMKVFFGELLDFKPDPRMPWPAMESAAWYTSTGAGPARTAAFRLAKAVADGRVLQPDLDPKLVVGTLASWRQCIEEWVTRLQKTVSAPPPLSVADRVALDAVERELDRLDERPPLGEAELHARSARRSAPVESTQAELVAAVLERPDDRAARLVYGDWLSERGDPRGELIVLQAKDERAALTGKEHKRVTELIRDHGASWIHPLDAVVERPRFRLGFLSGCGEIRFRTSEQRVALVEHPLWSTVEEIDECNADELLLGNPLKSLRALTTTAATLARLAERPLPLRLREIRCGFFDRELYTANDAPDDQIARTEAQHGGRAWQRVQAIGALADITRVSLCSLPGAFSSAFGIRANRFAWVGRTPFAAGLEHLKLVRAGGPMELAGWLEGALSEFPRLETLELSTTGPASCEIRFRLLSPNDRVRPLELDIGWPYYGGQARGLFHVFRVALAGFPHERCPDLRVGYVGKRRRASELQRFSADLEPLLRPLFRTVTLPDGRRVQR